MLRKFGKMGVPSSYSKSSTAPPITKYVKINCGDADSTFNPPDDKLYDCKDAENNSTDGVINLGKS